MRKFDPRLYQIGALALLLLYGLTILDFDVTPARAAAILAAAIGTQWLCSRIWRISFDPKSAAISGLSLCLLVRSNSIGWILAAAVIAVASKFTIRWRGKHIFNPTNGAIVALMLLTPKVWVSPGQWGSVAFFSFLLICVGGLVVNRAARSDVTYAFIAAWAFIVIGRSLMLGEPLTIPFHRLENGALLLFTFFMISDPKTTPNSRAGRILFAAMVALGAGYIQFKLFRTNSVLWSLAACSMLVPFIDWLLPARKYEWAGGVLRGLSARDAGEAPAHHTHCPPLTSARRFAMRKGFLVLILMLAASNAHAFCGFYVAKGDAKIYNKASQVVIVRDEDRTVMTMANDFRGEPRDFAMVIPVPTMITRGQIHIGDKAVIDHLDAYSAPRLVEYFDPDPCNRAMYEMDRMMAQSAAMPAASVRKDMPKSLGVRIEAQYTVGEYDILILSAAQSDGLETWLRENGYSIPAGASSVLASYIRQNMKFFVAKVNLKEQAKLGFNYLRPIQVAYEHAKFMLPIRLGTVNANGAQELFVYTLTRKGRVETTNYRTVKLPTDIDVPLYVRDDFSPFYKALFSEQVRKENMSTVFVEYGWDMNWCDPCASNPLSPEELRQLGVFWKDVSPFVTRLHVRYDREHFPEDLVFQQTGDRSNFQARYVLHHPWTGSAQCEAADRYRMELRERQEQEARNLVTLTGWSVSDIRKRMNLASAERKWWETIW
jgi:hypothetical protein